MNIQDMGNVFLVFELTNSTYSLPSTIGTPSSIHKSIPSFQFAAEKRVTIWDFSTCLNNFMLPAFTMEKFSPAIEEIHFLPIKIM